MALHSKNTPQTVERLINRLSALPGIGPKTASRLAFYLLRAPQDESRMLGEAILSVRIDTHLCERCFNIADSGLCPICLDSERDQNRLCVVEQPQDVLALEHVGVYHGIYHVLHGAITPQDGISADDLKINELFRRLESEGISEIILATNPTMEGDATAMYLQKLMAPLNVRLTRLARGLPFGTELEYADDVTLSRALEGRQEL